MGQMTDENWYSDAGECSRCVCDRHENTYGKKLKILNKIFKFDFF